MADPVTSLVEKLEHDIAFLKAAFHEMGGNEAEMDLKRQIKELLNDTQGMKESWLIRSAAVNNTIRGQRAVDYTLEKDMMSIIKGRLEPLRRMIEAYEHLQRQHKQPTKPDLVSSVQLNRDLPPVRTKKIVGFEDEAKSIINWFMQETEELDVISITGMPGIGKTTLAWKIYQDETIRSEFPTRIWVDIPLNTQLDLFRNILKEFCKQGVLGHEELVTCLGMPQESCSKVYHLDFLNEFIESDRIGSNQIIDAVHECLKKSRFLLVMDNVWTANTLGEIRHFLPKLGKVLLTSRNNRVSEKPHVLRFLNEKESWELLESEVFGKLGACPQTLKSTGESIAKSCDGSPLAIVAVGTSLGVTSSTVAAKYHNEKWWKKVSQNVILHVTDYVFKTMELSYVKLTPSLQDCFLYLGVFPQGQEIPVRTLIRLWIAERLVEEEVAEETLYDLIDKNLVMVGKAYPNGQIKSCRLHKLMYGFCKDKAAQQDFYHEIKMSGGGALDSLITLPPKHRRLCIYSDLSKLLSSAPSGRGVRSIICLNRNHKLVLRPKESAAIHECFVFLRVLECKYVNFTKFPNKLNKMTLLRYISLSCDDLDVIPKTIGLLIYLETLVVYTESASLKLKANIWRMLRLQHLVTKAAIVISTRGNGEAGSNLQTLTRLAPACCTENVLAKTPNLKTLGIRGKLSTLSEANAVRGLEFLENLKLINEAAAADIIRWQPDCFPPNLKRVTLSGTYLGWECMSVLGKIDSLEILKLKNNAFVGRSWNTRDDADVGFGRLGFLMIATADLVSWEASDECFPSLKCLVLRNCDRLEKIPSTLGKRLDTLDVEMATESAMESAREIEHEIARRQGQGTS